MVNVSELKREDLNIIKNRTPFINSVGKYIKPSCDCNFFMFEKISKWIEIIKDVTTKNTLVSNTLNLIS
jgi:hypothetical protein